MNKRCSVCNHPSRAEIDRALLTGVPYRPLAARYGLSPSALSRHIRHLKQQLARPDTVAKKILEEGVRG